MVDDTIPTTLHAARLRLSNELTCACLDALEPCIIKVWVPRISAVPIPSTATSATTEQPVVLRDNATLSTYWDRWC